MNPRHSFLPSGGPSPDQRRVGKKRIPFDRFAVNYALQTFTARVLAIVYVGDEKSGVAA